jgi:hypothetical protein
VEAGMSITIELAGGHRKPLSWRPLRRPANWPHAGLPTAHLRQRCAERAISEELVAAGFQLADICIPLENGRLKLGFSRRAIRRALHDPELGHRGRLFRKLVLVVGHEGALITAWLDEARPFYPSVWREERERAAA